MTPSRLSRPRLFGAALLLAFHSLPAIAQMPPPNVGVIEMRRQDVPRILSAPGRAVASEETAIRPRVGGMVTEILYRPGEHLEPGAPMFRLDSARYEGTVMQAESTVVSAEASARQARTALERAERLVGSGTTLAEVDSLRAALDQAEAAVVSAEAALRVARLELSWTTVTSPIAGRASLADVSVGDLVTANQAGAMATVTRLDPIEVDLYEPAARIQAAMADIETGFLNTPESLTATLTLENGRVHDARGELVAPGFTVSTTTGTIDFRFRFENAQGLILPGMFLRGQIDLGTAPAFLVSQSATRRDRAGQLSAMVVVDGRVEQRFLTEIGSHEQQWIVTEGLEEGDLLIADGFSRIGLGMEVVTVPVEVDASGVVRDAPAEATQPSGN